MLDACLTVLPFRALRPARGVAPVVDLAHGEAEQIAAALEERRAAGLLVVEPEPCVWFLEQTEASGHVQHGLVAAVPIDACVEPHEDVDPARVAHRLASLELSGTEVEPVLLVTRNGGAVDALCAHLLDTPPDLVENNGVSQRLWRLPPQLLTEVQGALATSTALIADGHHRWAAARERQLAGPASARAALAVLVDADAHGPHVHALHRVLPGVGLDAVLAAARQAFTVTALSAVPAEEDLVGITLTDGSCTYALADPSGEALAAALGPEAARSPAWKSLDVTIAHRLLVAHLLGLPDGPGTLAVHRTVDAAVAAAEQSSGTAVLLPPTPLAAVYAVALAGDRMPWKSTWFTPKPTAGLLMRAERDQ